MEDVKLLNIDQKLIKMTLNRKGKEKNPEIHLRHVACLVLHFVVSLPRHRVQLYHPTQGKNVRPTRLILEIL